jgi:hypothetical protein
MRLWCFLAFAQFTLDSNRFAVNHMDWHGQHLLGVLFPIELDMSESSR